MQCGLELAQHSSFLYTNELDSVSNHCLRALEGSSYEVRCSVSKFLGTLLSLTQNPLPCHLRGKVKPPGLDDVLQILSNGFVRGASGFLKGSGPELLKTGTASQEVRVGVTQVRGNIHTCYIRTYDITIGKFIYTGCVTIVMLHGPSGN